MKRIKTEHECQAIIAEQKKSGKIVAEYCLKHGIHPNVFYTKRKKYKRPGFVKLPVNGDALPEIKRNRNNYISILQYETGASLANGLLSPLISNKVKYQSSC